MNEILAEVRLTFNGDAFGTVQGWRFALCDYLADSGEHVPGFRRTGESEECYELDALRDINPSIEECEYALMILDRARNIIGAMGLDY